MVALKRFRATGPSFADLVPYAGLVDNGVLLLKDGSLMAGWYFAGPDSDSATDFERNELSRQINAILPPMARAFWSGGLIGCFHMSGLFVRYEV
ncbi:type IV secretory pathway VirB4 component [Sinorhizobium fredii]